MDKIPLMSDELPLWRKPISEARDRRAIERAGLDPRNSSSPGSSRSSARRPPTLASPVAARPAPALERRLCRVGLCSCAPQPWQPRPSDSSSASSSRSPQPSGPAIPPTPYPSSAARRTPRPLPPHLCRDEVRARPKGSSWPLRVATWPSGLSDRRQPWRRRRSSPLPDTTTAAVAALAEAAADTVSSEIGQATGASRAPRHHRPPRPSRNRRWYHHPWNRRRTRSRCHRHRHRHRCTSRSGPLREAYGSPPRPDSSSTASWEQPSSGRGWLGNDLVNFASTLFAHSLATVLR